MVSSAVACEEVLHTVAHSITSSARASNDCGTSSSIAFAVLKLIASSYLVGACTGGGRPASHH